MEFAYVDPLDLVDNEKNQTKKQPKKIVIKKPETGFFSLFSNILNVSISELRNNPNIVEATNE